MTAFEIGTFAPGFELPDTEGRDWGAFMGHGPHIVVFTSNECPYALAWHERLLAVAHDYAPQDVGMVLVSSNDAPMDSLDAMRARVAAEGPWPVPYLRDETQEVARAWGVRRTPECFLFDAKGRFQYHGAPDGDPADPSQNAAWLRAALETVLAHGYPERQLTEPVGTSIRWRE